MPNQLKWHKICTTYLLKIANQIKSSIINFTMVFYKWDNNLGKYLLNITQITHIRAHLALFYPKFRQLQANTANYTNLANFHFQANITLICPISGPFSSNMSKNSIKSERVMPLENDRFSCTFKLLRH